MSFFQRIQPKQWGVLIIFSILLAYVIYYSNTSKETDTNKEHLFEQKTMIVGLDTKVTTLDPRLIGGDPNSQYLEELIYSPLISFDENGNIKFVLADKIVSDDGKNWRIHLRKKILFRNGKELTAEDVIATYLFLMNPSKDFPQSPRKAAFSEIETMRSLHGHTLEIVLKMPDASFISNLVIGILPKEALSRAPNSLFDSGFESGPFYITALKDTLIHLKKNENYNVDSPAQMDDILFKIIPDSNTRFAALSKGDIDFIQNSIDPDKLPIVESSMKDKFKIQKKTRLATTYIGFNFKDPILQNNKIREAISYAIDRETILKYRLHSNETPATGMFPKNNFYYDDDLPKIHFDKEKSKKLIQESGLKTPIHLTLKLPHTNKSNVEVAKVLASQLNEVGIQMSVEPLENGIFMDQLKKGLIQTWLSVWVGFKDPDHLRFVFSSNMTPPLGGNRGFFSDKRIDELLEQGRVAQIPNQRKIIYNTAQQFLFEKKPYVYLWHNTNITILKKEIRNYTVYADGRFASFSKVTKTPETTKFPGNKI